MRLVCLFFILTATASALPIGNPSEPISSTRFRVGYYGDYVSQIDMSEKINNRITTNGLQFTLNCLGRVDLFFIAGLSKLSLRPDATLKQRTDEEYANRFFYMEATSTSSLSAGARATLFRAGNFSFGMEGQYFQMKPDTFLIPRYIKRWDEKWGMWETPFSVWQIGAATSYQFGKFLFPYVGVKWQSMKYDFSDVPTADFISQDFSFTDLENIHHLAYTFGIALTNIPSFSVSVETTLLNEKSLGITALYKF